MAVVLALAGCSGEATESDLTIATDVAVALTRGMEAQANGRVAEAEEQFDAVVAADPDNRVAWFNLGVLRRARGDVEGAIDAFSLLVDADPLFTLARYQRAITYQAADDLPAAVDDLRIVVEQDPSNVDAQRQLGALLVATGRQEEGRAILDAVLPKDG